MKITIYFIIFLFHLSCSGQKSLLQKMQGAWAPSRDQNVSFVITKNTVFYPEDNGKLDFKLNRNTMKLSEEGHSIAKWVVIKVTSDSLFLKTEDLSIIKLVKIIR